jgi:alkanesulfonate monooxygenase SsuD/methylene tetrahydromethanopterin reductase-like flavin-dependent oxidoreductase (luciferase family)
MISKAKMVLGYKLNASSYFSMEEVNPNQDTLVKMSKLAESGLLDFIMYSDEQFVQKKTANNFDPIIILSMLSSITKNIGLIGSIHTINNEPFHIARKLASIDHLSQGRLIWNVLVDPQWSDEFDLKRYIDSKKITEYTKDFIKAVFSLWDSWEEDAILIDKKNGIFADPTKVHYNNYVSPNFKIRGPLPVPRTPQGRPLISFFYENENSVELALHVGDITITSFKSFKEMSMYYLQMKNKMCDYGRNTDDIKILNIIRPVILETNPQLNGMNERIFFEEDGPMVIAGTAEIIAQKLTNVFLDHSCDGFVLAPASYEELKKFISLVVPILQENGVYKESYSSLNLREILNIPYPNNIYNENQHG